MSFLLFARIKAGKYQVVNWYDEMMFCCA